MQNNHIFHKPKLLSLIKAFPWVQNFAQINNDIPTKPEQQRDPAA
jgi:hypothetical protein